MNNNMPNNLNNGGPINTNPVNHMPDPAVEAANSELMGGQSTVGGGANLAQGMPGVQGETPIMQGTVGANIPNVMQGTAAPEPAAPAMPGMEAPVAPEEPGVVSIPSFAPNMPEPPVEPQVPNVPEPPVMPQMPNPGMNVNPMPEPPVMPNNPLNNPAEAPNVNIINEPAMPQQPMNPGMNDIPTNNIINNEQPNVNMVPPVNNMDMNPNPAPNGLNQIGEPNINQGMSQIGQTELGSMDSDMAEMPDMPEKKFPLSVREMVLIGIAIVGIVIVLIVYL